MAYERIPPATPDEQTNRQLNIRVKSVPFVQGATDFIQTKSSEYFADNAFELGFSGVVRSQSYMNLTQKPVWVTDRDNMPIYVAPAVGLGRVMQSTARADSLREEVCSTGEEFIIFQTLRYSADAVRQVRQMYQTDPNPSRLLRYIYESTKNRAGGFQGFSFTRMLRVRESEFRTSPDGLFNHSGDVWLSMNRQSVAHPFASFDALREMDKLLDIHALTRKLGLVVDFVLNAPVPAQRFFTFLGSVYEITSRPDPVREDGIYVYQSKDAHGVVQAMDIVPEFTPYHELIEHQHFFTTASDAKNMGNPEGVFKVMETKLRSAKLAIEEQKLVYEAKNTLASQELENLKQANRLLDEENKRIAADREKQISQLKHDHSLELAQISILNKREEVQLDRRKTIQEQEREAVKDLYDSKQMARKEINEGTKFAYGIATAAFGFVVALGTWLVSRLGKVKVAGLARLLLA